MDLQKVSSAFCVVDYSYMSINSTGQDYIKLNGFSLQRNKCTSTRVVHFKKRDTPKSIKNQFHLICNSRCVMFYICYNTVLLSPSAVCDLVHDVSVGLRQSIFLSHHTNKHLPFTKAIRLYVLRQCLRMSLSH